MTRKGLTLAAYRLAILLLLAERCAMAAHLQVSTETFYSVPLTNVPLSLVPLSTPTTSGNNNVVSTPLDTNTLNGTVIISNVVAGLYRVEVRPTNGPISWWKILVPSTNALVDASTIIVVTVSGSNSTNVYSMAAADARFLLNATNAPGIAGYGLFTDGTSPYWAPGGAGSGEVNVLGNSGTTNSGNGHLSLAGIKSGATLNLLTLNAGKGVIITNEAGTNLTLAVSFDTNGLATINYVNTVTNGFAKLIKPDSSQFSFTQESNLVVAAGARMTNLALFQIGLGPSLSLANGASIILTNGNISVQSNGVVTVGDGTGSASLRFQAGSFVSDYTGSEQWNFKTATGEGSDGATVARLSQLTNGTLLAWNADQFDFLGAIDIISGAKMTNLNLLNITNRGTENITGTLAVGGAATFTNGITAKSTLDVASAVTAASSVSADSVTVTNAFVGKSTANLTGALSVGGTVTASNAVNITGTSTHGGIATFTNGIVGQSTENLTGALNVGGTGTFSNAVNITGASTHGGTATFTNQVNMQSGLNLTGALNVGGVTTLSNAVTAKGGVSNETWQTTGGIATNLSDAYFKNVPPFSFLTVDGNGKLAPINGNSNGIVGNINNGFPQIRSKISTNGVLIPIWFGDSLVTGQLAAPQEENFVNSYGLAGFQGQQGAGYGPISWTATNVSATYTQDDFTSFFTTYYIVTNGGSVVWFTTNSAVAASANGVNANVITLDYIEESGAGTFKIQTNAAPAGAFADFQTGINANNGGAKHGVPLRYTNTFAANMMVKVVVTAGNPVKIIAPGLFNSTNGGTVLNIFAHGGLGIDQFVQCPTNVTGPIVAAWNPDLIVTKWLDSSTLMQASFASFNAFCSNYIPRCDILWVGANPIIAGTAANIADVKIANMAQFSNALFTAQSYFDGYSIFGTTNNAVARGYLSALLGNDPHPTVAGDTFTARLIAQWMDLFVHDTTAEGALTYTYPSTVANKNLTNAWLKTKTAAGVNGIWISESKIQSDVGIYMGGGPVVVNGDPNVYNPTDPLTINGNTDILYPGNLWLQGGAAGAGNFLLSWGVFSNAWNAAGDVAMNWKQPAGAYTNVAELKNSSSQTTFSIGSNGIVQYQVPGSATIYPAHYTVFTQTADGTACTNISTASTSILGAGVGSLTLPAGFWQVGRQLILDVEGDYLTGASPGNTYITAKLGSTVMCSNLFAITASMTNRAFYGKVTMTCRTNSAIGAISTSGELHFPSGAAFVVQQMTNIVTILDTTGAMAVDMPATNGATTTSIRSHNATLSLR